MRKISWSAVIALLATSCLAQEAPDDQEPCVGKCDGFGDEAACPGAQTIYLNTGGGSYWPGTVDDSSSNVSTVLALPAVVRPRLDDPYDPGYQALRDRWAQYVDCVRASFAPFNVQVTEEDPGAAAHLEVVLVSNPADVPSRELPFFRYPGLAPIACQPIPRAIVFMNTSLLGDTPSTQCQNTARVLGLSQGLDHTTDCADLMSKAPGCASGKSFVDQDLRCGVDGAGGCRCGGATQNSFRGLMEAFGPTCSG